MLRLLNTLTCVTMLGFAAVQYNDPDWWLWALYYGVPAFWAFMAGFRRRVFTSVQWLGWLWASLAAWAALVWYYWPKMPNWWLKSVWMQEETAREGMGLMIALATLVIALLSAYRRR
jgi:Transmembrane family 220, helix